MVLSGLGAAATQEKEDKADFNKISVSFSQPKLKDEGESISVSISETESYSMETNMPMLPRYDHEFKFPFGTKIKNVICTPKEIKEVAIDKEIAIAPAPVYTGMMVNKIEEPKPVLTEPYPESWFDYSVKTGIDGNERYVFVSVHVNPVKYNPIEKTIKWAENVDIKVEYEQSTEPTFFDDQYNFIILTPGEFVGNLQDLVTHKNNRGISTKLVTLNEIYSGTYFPTEGRDDQEKIKYFIKNAIESWGTSYVMLVGTWNERDDLLKFPVREATVYMSDPDRNKFVSDLYYADIYDGEGGFSDWDTNQNNIFAEFKENGNDNDEVDLRPDVHIGRLAANDGTQVDTCVNKIITYETTEAYTKDWFTNLIAIGGDSFIDEQYDEDGYLEGEYVNENVIQKMDGFIPTRLWVSNGVLGKLSPTGTTSIKNAINEGCGFIDFSGHGNTDVWATHPHLNDNKWLPTLEGGYFSNNIKQLTNGDKLPIIITGACSVSKYNKDDNSFSWTFLANANGGGIGAFGATALGYAYISKHVTSGLVERIAIETFDAYDDGAITLGEMWSNAINDYISYVKLRSDADYKTVEEWSFLGDPTTAIAEDSTPPDTPAAPVGKTNGGINTEYTYTAQTTDPDGDELYYLFDWGDGTFSGWVGPKNSGQIVSASHKWTTEGNYEIKVKAKDEHGVQSEWSPTIPITMPRSRSVNSLPMIQKILEIFPILQLILQKIQL